MGKKTANTSCYDTINGIVVVYIIDNGKCIANIFGFKECIWLRGLSSVIFGLPLLGFHPIKQLQILGYQ